MAQQENLKVYKFICWNDPNALKAQQSKVWQLEFHVQNVSSSGAEFETNEMHPAFNTWEGQNTGCYWLAISQKEDTVYRDESGQNLEAEV